jgi:hypothetical protein
MTPSDDDLSKSIHDTLAGVIFSNGLRQTPFFRASNVYAPQKGLVSQAIEGLSHPPFLASVNAAVFFFHSTHPHFFVEKTMGGLGSGGAVVWQGRAVSLETFPTADM